MWSIWGGGDKREGQFGGIESQKRVKVEMIEWRSIDLHSIIPNQVANAQEPIPHASWE
jgi:hypothetical protein